MKKLLGLVVSLCSLCYFAVGQENNRNDIPDSVYYYYNGEKVYLPLNKEHFTVYFDAIKTDTVSLYRNYSIIQKIEISNKEQHMLGYEIYIPNSNYDSVINNLKSLNEVIDVEPVLGYNKSILKSNYFYVLLNNSSDTILLKELLSKTKSTISDTLHAFDTWYEIQSDKNSLSCNLDICNMFWESGICKLISVGFIIDFSD